MIELRGRTLVKSEDFKWYRAFVDRTGCLPKSVFCYLSTINAN